MTTPTPTLLRHAKVVLALHQLRRGSGRPLLLLHGLGERSPERVPPTVDTWPGPVHALDFTGHGDSSVPTGGGYTCEVLMGDVDAALAELGPATLVGRGLGAYIALLAAGARPRTVRGAVLADGAGLLGGGAGPVSPQIVPADAVRADGRAPDPFALAELSRDVRPPDYAATFVRQAVHGSGLATPLTVAAIPRPPWLAAVVGEVGVDEATVPAALAAYASVE